MRIVAIPLECRPCNVGCLHLIPPIARIFSLVVTNVLGAHLAMTHDELIAIARTHIENIPNLSGEPRANMETLSTVTALDAVVVSFESDQHPKKIVAILEKESGKFILSGLMPRKTW